MRRCLALSLVAGGCDDVTIGVVDLVEVVRVARTFRDGDLERINDRPFVQLFGDEPLLRRNVWVLPLALDDGRTAANLYATIDPDAEDSEIDAAFPVGTIIVHEAVDGEQANALQIRAGDHWEFAKYFEDGTLDAEPCTPCVSCHSLDTRGGSEGLWGVPRDAL
jgi:hypothetical protein